MAEPAAAFHFEEAFSRSMVWLSEYELQLLRGKRVAIAGVGGVGGSHLLTLARLGVGAFNIADSDSFELANFNRQAGAMMSTIGRGKGEVMAAMAKDINPELDIGIFANITEKTVDAFLQDADIFLDGIDAFALEAKRLLFRKCAEKNIPAVTAGPFGTGSGYMVFMPGHMTFDDYFAFDGLSAEEQQIHFFLGITPKMLQRRYMADLTWINLKSQRGMTTPIACQLATAIACAEAMKIMLGRGKVYAAPYYQQFDPYLNRYVRRKLFMGMRNPVMQLKIRIFKALVKKITAKARPIPAPVGPRPVDRIAAAGLWAPSADNLQPWRLRIQNDHEIIIEVRRYATPTPLLAEKRHGLPNILAAGMMLENIRLAASAEGMAPAWTLEENDAGLQIVLTLRPDAGAIRDRLAAYIPIRSVNRKNYKTTPLTGQQKEELERAAGSLLSISWHSGWRNKLKCARVNAQADDIRLREPQSYAEITSILDWDAAFSPDRIPVRSLPASAMTRFLMRWALKSPSRVHFLNRYLAGTRMPCLEMDIIPGLYCAAHFVMEAKKPLDEKDAHAILALGGAVQRFWLTATKLGLVLQPSYGPIVFGYFGARHIAFSEDPGLHEKAKYLARNFTRVYGKTIENIVFMGRIGIAARPSDSRSLRKSQEEF